MISYDDIRHLQQYPSGHDSFVLSLYVNVDQSNAANLNRGFETVVENCLKQLAESRVNMDNGSRSKFESECERVLRFMREYTPRGRGLVIFSDSSRDFWWHQDLQVELPTEARWSQQPWVRPLLEVIEEHDSYCVVLLDKQRARLLTVDATGIQQQSEIVSDVPNKHVSTGTDHIWSQMHMERDHTKHIKWHVNRVVDELTALVDRMKIHRIVIGGPVEATSMFVNELPKRLQPMVIGSLSVPLDINAERLKEELRSVQRETEQKDEVHMVESLITAANKGDRAVLGITDTLLAIQEQRVYCLVVAHDYRLEGKQCDTCGVLVVGEADKCSFCGGNLQPAPDLINRASHRVLDQAGKVQMVSGKAAEKLAATGNGVGAILRF
jgi:peptide subunit release factor 1 (eRF1)